MGVLYRRILFQNIGDINLIYVKYIMKHTRANSPSLRSYDKWRFTLYTTFLLLILFNPWTYQLMNSLMSSVVGNIASKGGCPTLFGFGLHAVVFTLILRYLMDLRI